jgi:hypothetical protein
LQKLASSSMSSSRRYAGLLDTDLAGLSTLRWVQHRHAIS